MKCPLCDNLVELILNLMGKATGRYYCRKCSVVLEGEKVVGKVYSTSKNI